MCSILIINWIKDFQIIYCVWFPAWHTNRWMSSKFLFWAWTMCFLPSHWCFLVVHFLSGKVLPIWWGKNKNAKRIFLSSLFVFIAIRTCGFFLFQRLIFSHVWGGKLQIFCSQFSLYRSKLNYTRSFFSYWRKKITQFLAWQKVWHSFIFTDGKKKMGT